MGLLVDGAWQDVDMRTQGGHFVRKATAFHNYVTADGSPGPTGEGGFPARARALSSIRFAGLPVGASYADFPQAEKTGRRHLGLGQVLAVGEKGWEFGTEPGGTLDTINGKSTILTTSTSLGDPNSIAAVSPCRCFGTRADGPLSTMNRPKSSVC